MSRHLALSAVAALLAVCGGAPPDQGGPMVVTYYRDGEARLADVSPECRERIPELVRELVAVAEPVRLLVSEERIEEIRETLEAVEVVFPEPQRLRSASGNEMVVRRVLVPLSGEGYVGDGERRFATLFLGDAGYRSGPLMTPTGWPLAEELGGCARR
jgi:hypothetical protein